jgi:hypothetical protein
MSPSIRDLVPSEPGGEEARRGFLFQDRVAAGFFLEMIETESLTAVWCEADDDITLVWEIAGVVEGEFVQVKGDEVDHFWSAARLCRRGQNGKLSILERSLVRDRYDEPSKFRIVTLIPVNDELSHLTFPLGHECRQPNSPEYARLAERIPPRIKELRSPNGNDWAYLSKFRFEIVSCGSS